MKVFSLALCAIGIGLAVSATPVSAQSTAVHWGFDTRAMSVQECMQRARFAMGEQGLKVDVEDGTAILGIKSDVSVLVTCEGMGSRTYIHVVGASQNGQLAAQFPQQHQVARHGAAELGYGWA